MNETPKWWFVSEFFLQGCSESKPISLPLRIRGVYGKWVMISLHPWNLPWNLKSHRTEKENHLPTLHFQVPCEISGEYIFPSKNDYEYIPGLVDWILANWWKSRETSLLVPHLFLIPSCAMSMLQGPPTVKPAGAIGDALESLESTAFEWAENIVKHMSLDCQMKDSMCLFLQRYSGHQD